MAEEKAPAKATPKKAPAGAKPAAKEEKEIPIEELPFEQFVNEHYLPELSKAFDAAGISDLELTFANAQVSGFWQDKQRQFTVYFPKQDISGQKAFSCADRGFQPSTIEPFMIDERKSTLDLLVFCVMQRLNAQKWLAPN